MEAPCCSCPCSPPPGYPLYLECGGGWLMVPAKSKMAFRAPNRMVQPHVPHRGLLTIRTEFNQAAGTEGNPRTPSPSEMGQGCGTYCLQGLPVPERHKLPCHRPEGISHAAVYIIGTFYGPLWTAAGCRVQGAGLSCGLPP